MDTRTHERRFGIYADGPDRTKRGPLPSFLARDLTRARCAGSEGSP
jgi:hypothetical protein